MKGGKQSWDAAKPALEEVAGLLKGEEGPFFGGREPCYTDFIWVGFVYFVRRASESEWERMMEVDEVLRKQYEACKPWLERDD